MNVVQGAKAVGHSLSDINKSHPNGIILSVVIVFLIFIGGFTYMFVEATKDFQDTIIKITDSTNESVDNNTKVMYNIQGYIQHLQK